MQSTDLAKMPSVLESSRVAPEFLGPGRHKGREESDSLSRLADFLTRESAQSKEDGAVRQDLQTRASQLTDQGRFGTKIEHTGHSCSGRKRSPKDVPKMGRIA